MVETLVSQDRLQMQDVELLVDLVAQSAVKEVTVQVGECRVTVSKQPTVLVASAPLHEATVVAEPETGQPTSIAFPVADTETASAPTAVAKKAVAIEAPLVGVFHTALHAVKEGSTISTGDILGQIESMKLMNEVRAEISGTVLEVLAEDGSPVQYGQALFIVEEGTV